MIAQLRPALLLFALLSVLTGLAYPAVVTAFAQLLFASQANGSLIQDSERVLGSSLLGQQFSDPRFFWSRPSATAPTPYNAAASTGSNQGPSNPALHEAVKGRVEALRAAGGSASELVPVDLVTASGSGLDPHITPAAAFYQVARVAKARGLAQDELRRIVEEHIEGRALGLLGEPRVNVLLLNLALEGD